MSEESGLDKRRKALEELFFARKDQELLDRLRRDAADNKAVEALGQQLGIADQTVLKELVAAGIRAETIAAISLAPLVVVAWADGQMAEAERDAILKAAEQQGIEPDSPSRSLLSEWLQEEPGPQLLEAWCDYIHALKAKLDPADHRRLGEQLLGQARRVAQAAGGFMGIGKISSEEEQALSELKQPFK